MKWTSSLVDSLSGKLGGRVASVARGGIGYFRTLVIPRNPRSPLQLAVRAALSSVSVYWNTILSEADQEAWWDLATGSQTGQTLFGRTNQPRIYAVNSGRMADTDGNYGAESGTPDVVTTPPLSASTELSAPTAVVIDDSANTLTFDASATDTYNSQTLGAGEFSILFVYATHQQSASRASPQHPYQLLQALVRTAGDPDVTTPLINLATHGFTTQVGKVMYLKFIAQAKDGSVSIPIVQRVTITA